MTYYNSYYKNHFTVDYFYKDFYLYKVNYFVVAFDISIRNVFPEKRFYLKSR